MQKLRFLGGCTWLIAWVSWGGQTSRGMGSGLAFAPPSYSTLLNPATVASAPEAALAAGYRFENENAFASFVGGTGFVGLAAAYRQEGAKDVPGESASKSNIVEAAVAAKVIFLTLGGTYRKVENSESNFDVAGMLDFGPARIGVVFRDLQNGAKRVDSFAALKAGRIHFEVDAKKAKPFSTNDWLLDFGMAYVSADISLAIGYDATYSSDKMSNGEVHGGLSYRLMSNFFVEGMYRPFAQEWSSSDWLAGARVVF